MNLSQAVPSSSIGKKFVVALTGLLMVGFLITHLAANMLLFVSAETYNLYSHKLVSNPLIYGAEAFLVIVLLYHVLIALKITIENKGARPVSYGTHKALGKQTVASATMIWSGAVVFIFLILHLVSLKWSVLFFGPDASPPSSEGIRDLYSLVVTRFENKLYSGFYIFCMIILGFHLTHALQSSTRTLGTSHPKYLNYIKTLSCLLAITFTLGFSIFPIYFGFIK